VYKREAHDMWEQLKGNIRNRITRSIYHVEITATPQPAPPPVVTIAQQPGVAAASNGAALPADGRTQRAVASALGVKASPRNLSTNQPTEAGGTTVVTAEKIGRNEPCHCGSGKKFKKCHGA
jgi:preprotein translocase subunit SecA